MTSIIQYLIPLLSPMVTAAAKKAVPKIPKPLLPVVCTLAGSALEVLRAQVSGDVVDPQAVAMAGPAGVAVREIVNQLGKKLGIFAVK